MVEHVVEDIEAPLGLARLHVDYLEGGQIRHGMGGEVPKVSDRIHALSKRRWDSLGGIWFRQQRVDLSRQVLLRVALGSQDRLQAAPRQRREALLLNGRTKQASS